ncbi:DNA mismatch repair endonuclease MutL [Paenibacillus aurantius]|uniref:DNA mismatch repair protein MutL n=1 Tax=Paenibacillus aurantius TaxID=2918900 RepID=A0AA96L8W5_9BACL|nr:DNA mismatch repair endonuclease MutL [Paenibacillus aurantius]WNQ09172.1 DNA mismatch repair endonuclease MutL [Paenibacillus aurantius]
MAKITILDDHIANLIAAGEVVERPSSVVKELVENAVDAGSTRIDVTIEEGGLKLIRVKDNGSGMEPEDISLAFERHATSKIATGRDLFQIRTLGFRGEALPSIASVAKVDCTTSAETSGLGRRLVVEGGKVEALEEVTAPRGTDILVKELFYNTPARLKYMKTIQTELGHVSDYIYRLALAHPGIALTLKHNGHTLLQTLGNGDLLQVIAAIYGTATAKSMLPVEGEDLDYRLHGFVSKPELTRANRMALSVVVNGRYIRSNALAHAIMRAYHTLLPINRYPVAVLHLEMAPSLLDVNVHPAKLEVRFSKEAELLEFTEQQVRAVLQRQVHIPQAAKQSIGRTAVVQEQLALYRPGAEPAPAADAPLPPAPPEPGGEPAADGQPPAASWPQAEAAAASAPARSGAPAGGWPAPERYAGASAARPSGGGSGGSAWRPAVPAPPLPADMLARLASAPDAVGGPARLPEFPKLAPIGQLHGTYLVAQNEEGMFLIDQHAAHERINYEYYYEKFGKPAEASQELLVPITLEFTPSETELMKARLPVFEQAGVYIEPFGGNSFIVRAYPHWFPDGEEKRIIEEMAEWILSERKAVDIAKLREKASTLCSCKASIKANQSQTKVEMEALLDRLAACRNPYTCPHGRPIVVSFSTYELEKMFKRVM